MTPGAERRLLQIAIVLVCFVPLSASTMSLWHGPQWLGGVTQVPTDLDSHFRYLSGLFLVMGLAFLATVPRIEAQGERLRLLGVMVIVGGLARLASLMLVGVPSRGHVIGLCIELGVVPVILLWQRRIAGRYSA